MSASNRLAVLALGEGPYELVLRCEGAGEQRFSEFTLETLARAIGRLAPPPAAASPAARVRANVHAGQRIVYDGLVGV